MEVSPVWKRLLFLIDSGRVYFSKTGHAVLQGADGALQRHLQWQRHPDDNSATSVGMGTGDERWQGGRRPGATQHRTSGE